MIKKYFKKLVSVALAAAMVMGMSVTAFANETPVTNNNETKITLNEYELAEQLAAQTPETLSEEGFDSDEIASIKNYKEVYREHISSLNTLRGSVRKMRISHVKSIFPADTNGLQTFYKLFLYSFNNL